MYISFQELCISNTDYKQQSWFRIPRMLASQVGSISWQHKKQHKQIGSKSWQHKLAEMAGLLLYFHVYTIMQISLYRYFL